MQPLKMVEEPQQQKAVVESSFAQRFTGWGVQIAHLTPSNAERFEDSQLDLDQRVRQSGEW
jgi:hypothetical protein